MQYQGLKFSDLVLGAVSHQAFTSLSLCKHVMQQAFSLGPGCVVPAVVTSPNPSDALPARCDFPLGRLYSPAAPGDAPTPGNSSAPVFPGIQRLPEWTLHRDFSGSAHPCPFAGLALRGCRIRLMLRPGQLLPPKGLLSLGFAAGRFPPTPPACYWASWQLPGPDSYRQVDTSLHVATPKTPPPFLCSQCPRCWAHELRARMTIKISDASGQFVPRMSGAQQ